jgi:transcriptional accessory protein Tex/SPT6
VRAVVDVTDKEVIDCFQDNLYHSHTFEDFGRSHPSSISKLKDMITSWVDEEDNANAKYDSNRGKATNNSGSNNNKDQRGMKDRLGDQRGGSDWELIKILPEG